MTWHALRGDAVTHRPSELDSRRFGLSVGRVVVGVDTTDVRAAEVELNRTLRSAEEDVLIVRWPSGMVRCAAAAAASGRIIIAADTLSYWELPPERFAAPPGVDQALEIVHVEDASRASREAVAEIVQSSFDDYGSHYAADPLFGRDLALAGYVEWAESSLTDARTDVLLLTRDGAPVGLATLESSSEGDLEVLLCGLSKAAQGQGLYQRLLHGVARFAHLRGHRRLIISTQAQNIRAQRVWARAGFRPFAALTTVHALQSDRRSQLWPN
jgi:RimJ/RimL family protein N-acetyltransferase